MHGFVGASQDKYFLMKYKASVMHDKAENDYYFP
jgi:hypothetical protein